MDFLNSIRDSVETSVTLLDGAHRIVSTFLERHKSIKAYVVEM